MAHDEAQEFAPTTSDPSAMGSPRPPSVTTAHLKSLPILDRFALQASDSQFNALSGAIGGFAAGIVTCPLDVIKTKLQAQGGFIAAATPGRNPHSVQPKVYNGLIGTAKVILHEEGVRGLYRGLGPIVFGYLPTWAVWFTVYNKSKTRLKEYTDHGIFVSFWSSIIAGGCSTVATNPIWVIKTRLMSQSISALSAAPKTNGPLPPVHPSSQTPWHYRSSFDAAYKMYTTEGIRSFYSGLTPALLGLSHVAVQFPVYEYLRVKFTGIGMASASERETREQEHNTWLGVLAASVISKIMASTATYPHEVLRTRLQTQRRAVATTVIPVGSIVSESPPVKYRGVIKTFRTILHEEGWRAFYAGLGTNMMRAVPAATVMMLTYEYCMGELNAARLHGLETLENRV
ncbi:hypothetical protein Cpir12675_003467 [Ceratocystis pirilliformis]|uniref:Mitochondrial nicotinamide adenine dinucleotide transporter 1 n=1 Tax=Ceratocystis pirilliformis TaxID=259994 RepID=A0ABR3Z3P3_9PEZI